MIRYKVVNAYNSSSQVNFRHPLYTLYEAGTILEDVIGIGYFLYRTREYAEEFFYSCDNPKLYKIKLVETLGDEYIPDKIQFLSKGKFLNYWVLFPNPFTALCCKKIKVLD